MEFAFQILPVAILLLSKIRIKLLLIVLLVFLAFIAGFRSIDVGTDTLNYYLYFYRIQHGNFDSGYEPLWQLLNISVFKLGGDFNQVTFFASILTLMPLYFAFIKDSRYPLFSLFVYIAFNYYLSSFNIMRQMVAISWVLLALVYYKRENKEKNDSWKVAIFSLIAILFHYTAIIIIPILVLINITQKYGNWLLIQVGSLLAGILLGPFLFSLATRFLTFYDQYEAREDSIGAFINLALLNAAFLALNNIVEKKDKWFSLFFCFIIFSNLAIKIPFASRFVVYAGIGLTIFLANLPNNTKLARGYIPILVILIICYSLFRFARLFGNGDIFPYINVLFK